MGCLVALLAVISPRVALVVIWIFTDLVSRAFSGFLLPLIGLIALPWTTLAWVVFYKPVTGITGFAWFFVILGFLIDIGSYTGAYGNRDRLRND